MVLGGLRYQFDGYQTPFDFMATNPHVVNSKLLDICLKLGEKPDYLAEKGTGKQPTLLFHISDFGEPCEAAKMLLEAGADANIINSDGQTFLEFAKNKIKLRPEQIEIIESYIPK